MAVSRRGGVAAVVLNWNRGADAVKCVDSLLASSVPVHVIIVDNGSTDGSLGLFKKRGWGKSRVEVTRNFENLGYVGNNSGLERALAMGVDYVFVANNDLFVDAKCVELLMKALETRPKAAIACPAIMYASRPGVVWAAGGNFNNIWGKGSLRLNGVGYSKLGKEAVEVEQAIGAAMLVRASAVREVGLLDESYFAYYEETKWQVQMAQAGHSFVLEPRARAWHAVAASSGGGRSALSAYYLVRNRGRFIMQMLPPWAKPVALASLVLELFARVGMGLAGGEPGVSLAALKGFLHFLVGRAGKGF